MAEYRYLEGIVEIKKLANQVAKVDVALNLLEEDAQDLSAVSKMGALISEKGSARV